MQNCEKCAKPMSDKLSLIYGLGPECRESFSKTVGYMPSYSICHNQPVEFSFVKYEEIVNEIGRFYGVDIVATISNLSEYCCDDCFNYYSFYMKSRNPPYDFRLMSDEEVNFYFDRSRFLLHNYEVIFPTKNFDDESFSYYEEACGNMLRYLDHHDRTNIKQIFSFMMDDKEELAEQMNHNFDMATLSDSDSMMAEIMELLEDVMTFGDGHYMDKTVMEIFEDNSDYGIFDGCNCRKHGQGASKCDYCDIFWGGGYWFDCWLSPIPGSKTKRITEAGWNFGLTMESYEKRLADIEEDGMERHWSKYKRPILPICRKSKKNTKEFKPTTDVEWNTKERIITSDNGMLDELLMKLDEESIKHSYYDFVSNANTHTLDDFSH